MEDVLNFFDGRRPQFLCKCKMTSFFGEWKKTLIVSRMEDDLKFFFKWKISSKFFWIEQLQLLQIEDDLKQDNATKNN
jgi:hypothetical protein